MPPKPAPKNIVASTLKVKAFLTEDPQRTYRHACQRSKATKARISQLMKITEMLPGKFVEYMGGCEDRNLIKRFSGKTLLSIAGLESPTQRQQVVGQLMRNIEV